MSLDIPAPVTVGEHAYRTIRADIIFARLKPGQKLGLERLKEDYDVSVSTLREILSRLASDGLVLAEGQRGFQVAPVSLTDLREIADLRLLLECHAIDVSFQAGDLEWEGAVVAAHHKLALMEKQMLAGDRAQEFLSVLYGDEPRQWREDLVGYDRLRVAVNACTRLRFCTADGTMEFREKRGPGHTPEGFLPWFAQPDRLSARMTVVCGHWSTLDLMLAPDVLMLDSGCLWGGTLTGIRLDDRRVMQVPSRHPVQPKPFG